MKPYGSTLLLALLATLAARPLSAQADLSDVEMAHVAVTASNIDVAYAHLALALSRNPEVRAFAETMIRDHTAVNGQVADLARELGVTAMDNAMSRQLLRDAEAITDRLSRLRGADFDLAYAENELAYHQTVNGAVESAFIPNLENDRVREAFRGALRIFRGHERHAQQMVRKLDGMRP